MANTFRKIQTVTVGSGGSASIDFTSIPQTYTDLKIVLSARDNRTSAVNDFARLAFNSDTTNGNYTGILLYADGSAINSYTFTSAAAYRYGGEINGPSSTANCFSNNEIYIPNYRSSNNKSYSSENVVEMNSTTGLGTMAAGLWSNTAAITSISLTPANGTLFLEYTSATLYGVANVPITEGAKATGGIITADNNYIYHTFLSSDTFTPTQSITCDYLVVAGGGGGGARGGGGAGGFRSTVTATGGGGSLETPLSLTATAYTVTIGAGGVGAINTGSPVNAASGTNSVFGSITSTGGGNGAGDSNYTQAAGNGGSGGGASATSGAASTAGTGTTNQGYAGGTTSGGTGGGGGGGAGAVGSNGSANTGANGGAGVASSISGTSVTRAGGGGGGGNTTGGSGGSGGGGAGVSSTGTGVSGTVNTGGGGGGCTSLGTNTAGAGGSGIVIVRYAR
jgi:hypothetical protein